MQNSKLRYARAARVGGAPARLVVGIPAVYAEIQLRFEVPPALVLQGAPPLDRAARAAAVGAFQEHHDMALQVVREGGYVAWIRRVLRHLSVGCSWLGELLWESWLGELVGRFLASPCARGKEMDRCRAFVLFNAACALALAE